MTKRLQNLRKITVLAIVMTVIPLGVNAQTWYIMGKYMASPPMPQGKTLEVHQQSGPVDIAGTTYKTIKITDFEHVPNDSPIDSLVGAYREEGNQVYFRKWNGTAYEDEVTLYDYDLELGDFFNDLDEHPMMVNEVTTITDENGVERKKLTFEFIGLEDETEYWVEGVGSSRGFIFSGQYRLNEDKAKFHLLCYHVDNDVIYINPEFNVCDIDDVEESHVTDGIGIFPNPAGNIVKILNDNNLSINSIEIFDLTGRMVMSVGDCTEINIAELAEGQYFVKITGDAIIVKKLSVTR